MKYIKHFYFKVIIVALFGISVQFYACDDGNTDNVNTDGNAILTIKNESGFELTNVMWNNVSFSNDQVENSIKPGMSVTKTVQVGTGYIRFKPKLNPISTRTEMLVVVEKNEQKEFVFVNNTIVVNENNIGNNGTLSSFSGVPQITVKQSNTFISQYGQYDFGIVGAGNSKDITFIIENSGGANLTIETVNGNRVNLTNNSSEYFFIQQQPLAPSIAPGGSASFSIRFNPITVGNNINAAVNINTNSHTNGEFVFAVIGNSTGTSIGDIGPGGGFIFSTGGGQYMECSGELGSFSYSNAKTTAESYSGGGYNDWYFPTIGDLDLMYSNLHKNGFGGFLNECYWSSSFEGYGFNSVLQYYYKDFSSGSKGGEQTVRVYRVRAVRSFTLN